MRRFLLFLIFACALGFGGWGLFKTSPSIHDAICKTVKMDPLNTLEVHYSADKIMSLNKGHLLKHSGYSFLDPKLVYHPYLLLEVKYSRDLAASEEGILLWSLVDGEMVINATRFEKTHGFEDCLLAGATENDFKILRLLSAVAGAACRDRVIARFKNEEELAERWVQSVVNKKLVVWHGNTLRLHFASPRLEFFPSTHNVPKLVSRPRMRAEMMLKKYSVRRVKKLIKDAFGRDLYIREAKEVFLPVHLISVQNPDGSVSCSYWNGVTGEVITESGRDERPLI